MNNYKNDDLIEVLVLGILIEQQMTRSIYKTGLLPTLTYLCTIIRELLIVLALCQKSNLKLTLYLKSIERMNKGRIRQMNRKVKVRQNTN